MNITHVFIMKTIKNVRTFEAILKYTLRYTLRFL